MSRGWALTRNPGKCLRFVGDQPVGRWIGLPPDAPVPDSCPDPDTPHGWNINNPQTAYAPWDLPCGPDADGALNLSFSYRHVTNTGQRVPSLDWDATVTL
jgi:hypothetical protein